MIDEIVLRRQLVKPGLIPWMESYMDDMLKHFEMVENMIADISFLNVSNVEDFKKSIESYQKQHPNAQVYATAFVFNSKEGPKEECISCPDPCCEQKEVIDMPKCKGGSHSKKKKGKK